MKFHFHSKDRQIWCDAARKLRSSAGPLPQQHPAWCFDLDMIYTQLR